MKKKALLFFFLSIYAVFAFPSLFQNKLYNFYIDIPEGWIPSKIAGSKAVVSFTNPENNALFSIVIDNNKKIGVKEYFDDFIKEYDANGDVAYFKYYEDDAVFASLEFSINNIKFRGYFVLIDDGVKYYLLSSYSLLSKYDENFDYLISILDSFSINKEALLKQGPVSAFFYSKSNTGNRIKTLVFEDKNIPCDLDEKDIDASEVFIEREARLLYRYSNARDRITPWNRYYNLLYKDNYYRIKEVAELIIRDTGIDKAPAEEKVKRIAKWIQNFKYIRTGTISDITSPIKAILFKEGDCDSRTLLFIMLMDQLKIDAVMLVSVFYNHSAVGVNLNFDGAKISYNNKKYLFIELTEEAEIGMVPQKMADASKWIPMKIGYFE